MRSHSGRQAYPGTHLYPAALAASFEQVETQGRNDGVQKADETIVVSNFKPMKAGNRLEGKT